MSKNIIHDCCPGAYTSVKLDITARKQSVVIEAEGYSVCNTADDMPVGKCHRPLVALEIWDGEFRVIVWSDINEEDPTHIINLENAKVSNRDCSYCSGNCHRDPEHACDGYLGDIDNLH